MAEELYRHLFINGREDPRDFTNPQRGREAREFPVRDRSQHAPYLRGRLDEAWREAEQASTAVAESTRQGVYIEFASEPGKPLKFESLEQRTSGIILCNVRQDKREGEERTLATVYVPNNKRSIFLNKLNAYEKPEEGKKPRNVKLFSSISDIRKALLDSFWRPDELDRMPSSEPDWVEAWLRTDKPEAVEPFLQLLDELGLEVSPERLRFPERTVVLIKTTGEQLAALIERSDLIAEFRVAKKVASFYVEMENRNQTAEVEALLDRVRIVEGDGEVSVCVLDGGVNRGHALLTPFLDAADMHAYDPNWGTQDDEGHGTLMAGAAVYRDLLDILQSNSAVRVVHKLESSKILPPPPATNPKRLWGDITAQGVSRAEIQAPHRRRVVCLAVTSDEDRDRGRPSSWSGALDAMASGYEEDTKRLVIVSAGNVDDSDCWRNYPHDNYTNEVHDPGQAWNALTVGAYTNKTDIHDTRLSGYQAIADAGGLSPYSTTSLDWQRRLWPIKPDIVLEGGNVARGPNDSIFDTDDLKLLSTYHDPQEAQFAPFCATSAAAAQASWMAAQIFAAYPVAWPETVRGLMVHSATWTDAMKRNYMPPNLTDKKQHENLLRVCGYGVPSLRKALYSLSSSLTLISQAQLQPFCKRGNSVVTNHMHLYNLPWPSNELAELGETLVEMRVTLSYFVEPGPGEVGWNYRYRYPSHALRFALNGPLESEPQFVQRINRQARDEEEGHPGTSGPADKWQIGDEARNVGSVHSDIWRGTAADLARSNLIAVYPTTGWWKERKYLNRWESICRYSLIVSIDTPEIEQEIDIYTPVAVQVGIPIPIPIPDVVIDEE